MSLSKEDLRQEEEYLKKVLQIIEDMISSGKIHIRNFEANKNAVIKYLWSNIGSIDELELSSGLNETRRDTMLTEHHKEQIAALERNKGNPYFARIDFQAEDEEELDKVYLGIVAVMEPGSYKGSVVDWRSPIASLYYNNAMGEATYQAPSGLITGKITLRRQYKIENGRLVRCIESKAKIDDDKLQSALAESSEEKMRQIVETIQADQDRIIRNQQDKYLIVQGSAGSGKTSVALHRIAYLLFNDKGLDSHNVLIFSPNEVFSDYISEVLPQLGEENVLQTTFSDFANQYITGFGSIETFSEFIERYYRSREKGTDFTSTSFKLSDEYKKYLDNYLKEVSQTVEFKKGFTLNKSIEYSQEILNGMFKEKLSDLSIGEKIDIMAQQICYENNVSYPQYGASVRSKIKKCLNINFDSKKIYRSFLETPEVKEKLGVKKITLGDKLNYEDLLGLLYLTFELNGYPRSSMIRQVIIDEAQDYTPIQLSILKKIFANASFTVLGDVNQTVNPCYQYESLEELHSVFGEKANYVELKNTYRSSKEIIDFTNEILGLDNVCAIRDENDRPVITREVSKEELQEKLQEDIQTLRDNGVSRIGVITKNADETEQVYELLREVEPEVGKITQETERLEKEITVLPSYISKGLEFDGVIACTSAENTYDENEQNLFYVVCTRAQNNLVVYNPQKKLGTYPTKKTTTQGE